MAAPNQPDDLASVVGARLNQFHIHGQDYGVSHNGGIGFSTDPERVQLRDFGFPINERFLYEYDFGDRWQHDVRIEARLKLEDRMVTLNALPLSINMTRSPNAGYLKCSKSKDCR